VRSPPITSTSGFSPSAGASGNTRSSTSIADSSASSAIGAKPSPRRRIFCHPSRKKFPNNKSGFFFKKKQKNKATSDFWRDNSKPRLPALHQEVLKKCPGFSRIHQKKKSKKQPGKRKKKKKKSAAATPKMSEEREEGGGEWWDALSPRSLLAWDADTAMPEYKRFSKRQRPGLIEQKVRQKCVLLEYF
jgi:hypothetical protein